MVLAIYNNHKEIGANIYIYMVGLNLRNTFNSGHPRDQELLSLIARVRNEREFITVQTSVIYVCRGSICCPYYRGVRNSEVF